MHLSIAMLILVMCFYLWSKFDATSSKLQFYEIYPWITTLGISYIVGLDGINIMLLILTVFLTLALESQHDIVLPVVNDSLTVLYNVMFVYNKSCACNSCII